MIKSAIGMTPPRMRITIREFIASSNPGERIIGELLKPLLDIPEEELIDAVRVRLREVEEGAFAFSKEWLRINGE